LHRPHRPPGAMGDGRRVLRATIGLRHDGIVDSRLLRPPSHTYSPCPPESPGLLFGMHNPARKLRPTPQRSCAFCRTNDPFAFLIDFENPSAVLVGCHLQLNRSAILSGGDFAANSFSNPAFLQLNRSASDRLTPFFWVPSCRAARAGRALKASHRGQRPAAHPLRSALQPLQELLSP
jgi:hypothetical protein